jgi:hypothetical protein
MPNRRQFIRRLSITVPVIPFIGSALVAPRATAQQEQRPPKPPPLSPELVKEFVVAGHGNLPRVKELLAQEPGLLNATWDWGGGDFETALGGASHVGRPEIAEFLLASGARIDVFCAAMLGRRGIVEACIAEFPNTVTVKGPHGISLLRHAQAGKQDALVTFLVAAGAV